jgi:dCTP diphosphatase
MDVPRIQAELARFAEEREWERFHSPKNLAMALAGEVGELISLFQWLSEDESRNIETDSLKLTRIHEEMADVLIYLLRLADVLNVDIEQIVDAKMADNATRYPVASSRGNAIKYSERDAE